MTAPSGPDQRVKSSHWDGLSPHLIATFYPVRKAGETWARDGGVSVQAPLTEASLEVALNWQSPFENFQQLPQATLTSMLQAGQIQPVIDAFGKAAGDGYIGGLVKQFSNSLSDTLKGFEGRTAITKLNSTQVFNGMPPLKLQVTAQFRAWKTPKTEVVEPVDQLLEWALPEALSGDGSILARAAQAAAGQRSTTDALMPSLAPICIAMQYKGRTYSPLVIESISLPLGSPIDRDGDFIELAIPLTLCSLTAIDRADWLAWSQPANIA